LNNLNKKDKKWKLIEEINHEIERLELNEQAIKNQKYLDSLSNEERISHILTKEMGVKL
jgi:hypothetical protein